MAGRDGKFPAFQNTETAMKNSGKFDGNRLWIKCLNALLFTALFSLIAVYGMVSKKVGL